MFLLLPFKKIITKLNGFILITQLELRLMPDYPRRGSVETMSHRVRLAMLRAFNSKTFDQPLSVFSFRGVILGSVPHT